MARPVITLYSRPGCHLCEAALGHLRALQARLGFEITEVDIESDDGLLQRYVFEIPVVVFEGRELARAPISPVALEEALEVALNVS